ncbi:hypothetical protein Q4603_05855 [Zobellia galactanivorans]|uniref:hypothetical protein n=1 Tax=Zobellia galactanivorans (strain DSM 12802 / CCUG 47099 / CIP 106680 / NCIMB 13871 / Dsij) TaxID=63186 RepID=UPI0026E238E3|nr:hypothetical protein [Zobellia galactanivorans]MDO6808120.1 hypothetical protein [Zobellia galactanivorans]
MYETYNNILCVHGGWLYDPKGANVMSRSNYKYYQRTKTLQVLRNGGGPNTPALVAWASVPEKYREVIIDRFGDPEKTDGCIQFMQHLEQDINAIRFYKMHTLPNGNGIPEPNQARYASEAAILNAVNDIFQNRILRTRTIGTGGLTDAWKKMAAIIKDLPHHKWPHSLPKNHRSLKRKYKAYLEDGYESLIHGGHAQKNAEKINDHAKLWLLARWSDRVRKVANMAQLLSEYNEKAAEDGWKKLKEEKTLHNYLYQPEVKSMWYGYRYGELKAKEKYSFQNSTKMPTLRDSLWYADGTKLNFFYKDENGKRATCQVYEVMDAFSEVFLGYHVSKTEDFEAQYFAFKMAVKNSGHRPYEVRFDGQGGHKKLVSGNFMNKLAHLAIKTTPYNGKSKTIESAFGRFQSQYLKRLWFFTGQNITAKKDESQFNVEMILANTENLPTLKEAIEAYEQCRLEWNQSLHYDTNRPRIDMYLGSKNPKAPAIDMLEMVDIFWIERQQPVKLTAYGLTFTEKKQKYTYMVYNEDRMPDFDFLEQNIDRKFHIKYDPDDMGLIYLYEMTPLGLRRVTAAETKIETARNIQEQEKWEAEYYQKVASKAKEKRIEKRDEVDSILAKFNMLPEDYGLNSPKLKGLETRKKSAKKKAVARDLTIGEYQKALSNMEGEEDLYDRY